jgi:peptidyl-tRNA hydrolase
MSPEKLAAQVGHVVLQIVDYSKLGQPYEDNTIVVLKASATKFKSLQEDLTSRGERVFVQKDLGLTEVAAGTETVFGYIEDFD